MSVRSAENTESEDMTPDQIIEVEDEILKLHTKLNRFKFDLTKENRDYYGTMYLNMIGLMRRLASVHKQMSGEFRE